MIRRIHERLKGYYIFVLVFILWIVICKLEVWNQYIMPTPQKVYTTFKNMIIDGSIFENIDVYKRQIEESIYILQYEYKRKASLDRYRNSSNNLESMIDKHIQEYNRFVNFIINNNYDMPKIKAALKQIEQNYIHIFKLDYRNLFFKFRFKAPMAIFAMLTIDKMRELYLFNDKGEEKLSKYIKTLEDCDCLLYTSLSKR